MDIIDITGEDKTGKLSTGSHIYKDKGLTSLKGSPQEVIGNFIVDRNKLTSLEWAPKKIQGYLNIFKNNIPFADILIYLINSSVSGQIVSDYDFDFERFKNSGNKERIKMIFEDY